MKRVIIFIILFCFTTLIFAQTNVNNTINTILSNSNSMITNFSYMLTDDELKEIEIRLIELKYLKNENRLLKMEVEKYKSLYELHKEASNYWLLGGIFIGGCLLGVSIGLMVK